MLVCPEVFANKISREVLLDRRVQETPTDPAISLFCGGPWGCPLGPDFG